MASSSHERKVDGYLKPSNFSFLNNYAEVNKISQSKAVNEAVKALKEKVESSKKKY